MSDELLLPTVPEATSDDPEDVSWALSTAEAMWARGDHLEGIKWVRRAAEAASETENDLRALELAKAAADLTSLISRMSRAAAIEIEEVEAISDVEPAPPPAPKGRPPPPKASAAPKPLPTSVTKQVVTPSRPPAPLPSRTSQPPGPGAVKGKPLGTNTGRPPSMRPGAVKGGAGATAEKRESKRAARRSRENLDAEARAALALQPAPTGFAGSDVATAESPVQPVVQVRSASADPTAMSNVNDIVRAATKRTTDEWDLSPTQNLTGEELPYAMPAATPPDGSAQHTADFKATMQSFPRPGTSAAPAGSGTNPPATVAAVMPQAGGIPSGPGGFTSASPPGASGAQARPATATTEPHDPQIMTAQAVRVVVWRDASGVHVAPAGTIVSAITVDAMLVALEPNADLTAWLSQRTR